MKRLSYTHWLLLLLVAVNIVLLYHYIHIKMIISKETSLKQHAEWATFFNIGNVGQTVSLDSIAKGHHLLLRYDSTTCLTCIAKAEKLLIEVFGTEYLAKELCCIGERGQVQSYKDILFLESSEKITSMDDVYMPYFCVINNHGEVLYTLSLIPDMYDFNYEILNKLRRSLKCREEESE